MPPHLPIPSTLRHPATVGVRDPSCRSLSGPAFAPMKVQTRSHIACWRRSALRAGQNNESHCQKSRHLDLMPGDVEKEKESDCLKGDEAAALRRGWITTPVNSGQIQAGCFQNRTIGQSLRQAITRSTHRRSRREFARRGFAELGHIDSLILFQNNPLAQPPSLRGRMGSRGNPFRKKLVSCSRPSRRDGKIFTGRHALQQTEFHVGY